MKSFRRVAQLSSRSEPLASPASPIVSYSQCSSPLTPSREDFHLSLKSPEVSDRTEPPAAAVNPNEYDPKIMPGVDQLLDESYGNPLYKNYFIIVGGNVEDLKPIIADAIRRNVSVITVNNPENPTDNDQPKDGTAKNDSTQSSTLTLENEDSATSDQISETSSRPQEETEAAPVETSGDKESKDGENDESQQKRIVAESPNKNNVPVDNTTQQPPIEAKKKVNFDIQA